MTIQQKKLRVLADLIIFSSLTFSYLSCSAEDSVALEAEIATDENEETTSTADDVKPLSEIEVIGVESKQKNIKIDPVQSSTTIGKEEIKRRQANDVMELINDIAGVTIEGGVRSNGKKINIRGFSNNEDILKMVDGARQNFERYRYGNGLDIDPSLLQEVEIIRGNNVQTAGSGTIGGAVLMRTKNARDMLDPGEKYGLVVNTAYYDNNNQKKAGLTAYAQPLPYADILFNVIKNRSNDVTLPDKSKELNSDTQQFSSLTKISFFSMDYNLDLGYRYSDETGLEPFDAVSGIGVGGFVRRHKTTKSPTMNFNWNPESLWTNLDATLAYNEQLVVDDGGTIAAGGTDIVGYKILNLELKNNSEFTIGPVGASVSLGLQSSRERREYTRISIAGVAGFNESQPPGEKKSSGIFVDSEFKLQDWTFNLGARYDDYNIETGGITKEKLIEQDRSELINNGFNIVNIGTGLSFQPNQGPITLFYNYGEAFRAPLIDELYTLGSGGFSRCSQFSTFLQRPIQPTGEGLTPIERIQALIHYNNVTLPAWQSDPFNSGSASCAGFYDPETSSTHELGLSADWQNLFNVEGDFKFKLTYFQIRTKNLIESIYQNSLTGEVSQPGVENRHGFEIELNYNSDAWFSNISVALMDGDISYNYFENNIDTRIRALQASDNGKVELFNVPGDSLSFSLGRHIPNYSLELGYRVKINGSRLVSTDSQNPDIPECLTSSIFSPIPSCNLKDQLPGYTLHNLFASWEPIKGSRFDLSVNNLTNKEYITPGFGGSFGQVAAGRDVRLSFEHKF